MPVPNSKGAPARIVIQLPAPAVDGGRYPVKRVVGDTVRVSADVFRDGHEILRAVVRYKAPGSRRWVESPLRPVDAHINGVRWAGEFNVDTMGRWQWTIEAWSDVFATWRDELQRKVGAGQEDLAGELSEGVVLLEQAATRAKGPDRKSIEQALEALRAGGPPDVALAPDLFAAMERASEREGCTALDTPLVIEVDRVPAAFASWSTRSA
jgi:starch synthase (maltosyl-transferring)